MSIQELLQQMKAEHDQLSFAIAKIEGCLKAQMVVPSVATENKPKPGRPPKTAEPKQKPVEVKRGGPRVGIRDAIRAATASSPRTIDDIVDQVCEQIPTAERQNVRTAVSQMLSEGKLVRGNDLRIRVAEAA